MIKKNDRFVRKKLNISNFKRHDENFQKKKQRKRKKN